MLKEYDIINEYGGKYLYSTKRVWPNKQVCLKILEQYLENSLLLQSNKLGRNYFKEKQLKKQNFHCFYVILLIADAWKAGFFWSNKRVWKNIFQKW